MTQKKKVGYQAPRTVVVETSMCNMLCASIVISDEETNTAGRVSRRGDRDIWEEGLWGNLWEK